VEEYFTELDFLLVLSIVWPNRSWAAECPFFGRSSLLRSGAGNVYRIWTGRLTWRTLPEETKNQILYALGKTKYRTIQQNSGFPLAFQQRAKLLNHATSSIEAFLRA
jgi:hypothetical protein